MPNIKCLSLWQPWASLVALGEKRVETRCWSTKHRGLIAIHSTQNLPPDWLGASRHSERFRYEVADILKCAVADVGAAVQKLPRASVLCVARIVCVEQTDLTREVLSVRERIFGNYEPGRYSWFLTDVRRFTTPIPAKGNRMLWNWNAPDNWQGLLEIPETAYLCPNCGSANHLHCTRTTDLDSCLPRIEELMSRGHTQATAEAVAALEYANRKGATRPQFVYEGIVPAQPHLGLFRCVKCGTVTASEEPPTGHVCSNPNQYRDAPPLAEWRKLQ